MGRTGPKNLPGSPQGRRSAARPRASTPRKTPRARAVKSVSPAMGGGKIPKSSAVPGSLGAVRVTSKARKGMRPPRVPRVRPPM